MASGLQRLLPHDPTLDSKPKVEQIDLDARLAGSPRQWLSALADAGFTGARLQSNALELQAVHSLNLSGQPHEYVSIRLAPHRIRLSYTCLPSQRPERRRLEAARLLLLTLSALPVSSPPPSLSAWLSRSLDHAISSLQPSTESLLSRNAELEQNCRQLSERLKSMSAQREADARALLSSAQSLEALQARLDQLLTLPDAALDEEVMDWLRAHDGQVRLRELASHHQVAAARIEECLDRLSKAGRIARSNS